MQTDGQKTHSVDVRVCPRSCLEGRDQTRLAMQVVRGPGLVARGFRKALLMQVDGKSHSAPPCLPRARRREPGTFWPARGQTHYPLRRGPQRW